MKHKEAEALAEDQANNSDIKARLARALELNDTLIEKLEANTKCLVYQTPEGKAANQTFHDRMQAELAEILKPIHAEKLELEGEIAQLPEAPSLSVLAAKKAVLSRAEQEALAGAGNPEMTVKLRTEIEGLEEVAQAREANLRRIHTRLTEIAGIEAGCARQVFQGFTEVARQEYRSTLLEACDQLEGIIEGLRQFSQEHGIAVSQVFLNQLLKPGHIGPDRPLRGRLEGLL